MKSNKRDPTPLPRPPMHRMKTSSNWSAYVCVCNQAKLNLVVLCVGGCGVKPPAKAQNEVVRLKLGGCGVKQERPNTPRPPADAQNEDVWLNMAIMCVCVYVCLFVWSSKAEPCHRGCGDKKGSPPILYYLTGIARQNRQMG